MKKNIIFLILSMNLAGVCLAQTNDTSVGTRGSSSMGVGNAAVGGAPSIGGGNSVASGYSAMGVGNAAAASGYYATGPGNTGGSGYTSKGYESSAGYGTPSVNVATGYDNPMPTEESQSTDVHSGEVGLGEVQPSSVDTPVDPSSNPNSSFSNGGMVSDPGSAQ